MSNARNIAALSTVEVGATADQTKADIDALGINRGRKNLLINGGMDVWQRGTSFTSGTVYTVDRCLSFIGSRGDTSFTRSTDVPSGEGFKYSMALLATQANGLPFYRQIIEDFATVVTSNKAWTMSFWAKASVSMTISSDLGDQASKQHSLTTTWQRFTNVIPIGTGFSFTAFDIQGNSSAGTIYITGVQLELGSVATDFEHRSYGEELALCQRYCYVVAPAATGELMLTGISNGASTSTTHHRHPVEMRAKPSLSYSALSDFAAYSFGSAATLGVPTAIVLIPSIASKSWSYIDLACSGNQAGYGVMVRSSGNSSRLTFDAEL